MMKRRDRLQILTKIIELTKVQPLWKQLELINRIQGLQNPPPYMIQSEVWEWEDDELKWMLQRLKSDTINL
jgi:hypothetical protein